MRFVRALLLIVPAIVLSAYGETVAPPAPETPAPAPAGPATMPVVKGRIAPGGTVIIPATDGSKASTGSVTLIPMGTQKPPDAIQGRKGETGEITFTLPETIEPGNYWLKLNTGDVHGSIDVERDDVTIGSVHPTTAYHVKDAFSFTIVGDHFSTYPADNHVLVDGQDIIDVDAWCQNPKHDNGTVTCPNGAGYTSEKDCNDAVANSKGTKTTCFWVKDSHQMGVVNFKPDHHLGVTTVAVRVGEGTVSGTQQIVFARISPVLVFVISAAVTTLLFWIVTILVRGGLANKKVGDRTLRLWEIFVFDPETNSYSLSKFQLLVFSITFIFGYLYVLLSTWLVQWKFELPDVPNTISGLLGISAGTTIASAGLTATRGAKGAGLQSPTGADLISSGGVVVPERFQFFVWTIVACTGFIALLVGQDPANVHNFPDIPSGLLYVMGVSAAGYLGGKAARKPGPVLELAASEQSTTKANKPGNFAPRFVLTIQGHNLDSQGRFLVDDQELGILSEQEKAAIGFDADEDLVEPTTEAGAADPNFCSQLKINIPANKMNLSTGSHDFRIVNRDGQFADVQFQPSSPAQGSSSPSSGGSSSSDSSSSSASSSSSGGSSSGDGSSSSEASSSSSSQSGDVGGVPAPNPGTGAEAPGSASPAPNV